MFFSGEVCSKFAKDSPVPSQIIQKINMKCVEARRPQRIRVPLTTKEKNSSDVPVWKFINLQDMSSLYSL